jgi:transposase, IS30 family
VLQMTNQYFHLNLEQRYQLQSYLECKLPVTAIATNLGVHRSTVYREIKRNSLSKLKPPDVYKAKSAAIFAKARSHKKVVKYSEQGAVVRRLKWLLGKDWSPEQIAKTCAKRGIAMMSIESIYMWIYAHRKCGKDYTSHLRRHHRKRRKRRLSKQPRIIIKDRVSIHQRDEVINQQQRIGDWEVDLVKAKNGYVVNITERKSLFNLIEKIATKDALSVQNAIIKAVAGHKNTLFSITSDNGTEFAQHQTLATTLNLKWYFADPYKSQQRGCNENQNGLLRQYIKRDTDLNLLTEKELKNIQEILNNRPRKKINFLSPKKYLTLKQNVALAS